VHARLAVVAAVTAAAPLAHLVTVRSRAAARTAAEAIREAEDALRGALLARDREALRAQVSADFATGDEPPLDRTAWLDQRLGPCGGAPSAPQDFHVAIVGDTGLASYAVTELRDTACSPASVRARVASVWRWDGAGCGLYQRDLFAGILQRYGGDAGIGLLPSATGSGSTRRWARIRTAVGAR
jgi:hypothetical protein